MTTAQEDETDLWDSIYDVKVRDDCLLTLQTYGGGPTGGYALIIGEEEPSDLLRWNMEWFEPISLHKEHLCLVLRRDEHKYLVGKLVDSKYELQRGEAFFSGRWWRENVGKAYDWDKEKEE